MPGACSKRLPSGWDRLSRVEYNLIIKPRKDDKITGALLCSGYPRVCRDIKKAGRFRVPPVESLDDLPDALAPDALAGDHEGYDHRYASEVEHFQPLSL